MSEDLRLEPVLAAGLGYTPKERKAHCSVDRKDWVVGQWMRVHKILQLVDWSASLEAVGPVTLQTLLELAGRFRVRSPAALLQGEGLPSSLLA